MKKRGILLIGVMAIFTGLLPAQIIKTKLDIVGGVSAREFVHGGLRYQYTDITQFGLYYGGDMGISDAIVQTYCADNLIHFGSLSYFSNRPVWYLRQSFTYSVNKENDRTRKYSYVNLGAGREFGITNWLGFNFDMGLIVQLREKKEFPDPDLDAIYDTKWYWLPMFRLQLFITL
jgi:hypothetical protein